MPSPAWRRDPDTAGVGLYLLSAKWFRHLLALDQSHWRGLAALFVTATAWLGFAVSSAAQIAAMVATLVGMLVVVQRCRGSEVP